MEREKRKTEEGGQQGRDGGGVERRGGESDVTSTQTVETLT